MKFIARKEERKRLGKALAAKGQTASLVYGRRRVGKSELIKKCLTEVECIKVSYECKQTSEANNAESLGRLASEALGLPPLAFTGIEALLEFLFERAEREPLVLVLDEYPYLRACVKGLDSILQSLIDRHRDTSQMKLVLCGSYVDVMKSLLEEENPLFGRIDLAIDLQPMDYYDSSLFYPTFSPEDKVRLYSVFGGIPQYNRLIDPGLSVRENIIELITAPGSRLETEASMYLGSEIRKISNANEVFEALSQGYARYGDLLAQSHVSSGPTMVDVLTKLANMGLVRREAPINAPDNRRKASYRIIDQLSLFYYRYVFRFSSQRAVLDQDVFYDRYVQDDLETQHVPHQFEEVCRQYLLRQNRRGALEVPFDDIGRYSYDDPAAHTNGEFDVVTRDPRGYAFYEAKFRGKPIDRHTINDEIKQVEATGLSCHTYGFFSRAGFSTEPKGNEIFYTLEDLYR